MSTKKVDERVVSMQFDNKNFESNVKTSMGTIEKLKQSLKFKGASKGLDDISKSAKKVDMSGIGNGVEAVKLKFSALQVIATTALANITNSAINTGRKMIDALTLEPIRSGFQEYETQINAVQTILANTSSKGTNLDQVNAALDELNRYADLTIYNFTEMTRNIGTFTAAGIDLDTSVSAIQGIANLAAVSGSTSQQASTAMYQLSQALAAGTVKLMDWNSVVNAGMGGEVFQNALKKTSELLGTGAEAAIEAKGSFRESLQTGWLTSQVLTETLKKFTTSGANEYVAEYCGVSKEAVEQTLKSAEAQYGEADAIDKAAEALAAKTGKNKDEIKDALQLAKTAQDAATKVKTFSQLIDTLKEALQSGWTQSWEIIIGDFEEAKELFTGISNFLNGVINSSAEARNALLESALGQKYQEIFDKINSVTEATETVAQATKEYADVVNDTINGSFGNGEERIKKLTEAGYDWAHIQNLVNEQLGDATRHATDYAEAQESVHESQARTVDDIIKMSDAQLKQIGFTKDEIEAFRDLEKQSEKTGYSIQEIMDNPSLITGRSLLIDGFKNIGTSLVNIFKSIGQAYRDIFPAHQADTLYDAILSFRNFTSQIAFTEESSEKLRRTFRGLFSVIHLITTITGGGLRLALRLVTQVLKAFDLDILDVTASIGDAITRLHDFILQNGFVTKAVKTMAKGIVTGITAIKDFINAFLELPKVKAIISELEARLQRFKEIGTNVIEGLVNGIQDGISRLSGIMTNIGQVIIDAICKVLDIHSPSRVMFEIGKNIIQGLINGILWLYQNAVSTVTDIAKNIVNIFDGIDVTSKLDEIKTNVSGFLTGIKNTFDNINFGNIFAGIFSGSTIYFLQKITSILNAFAAPFKGLGEVFSSTAHILDISAKPIKKTIKNYAGMLKAKKWQARAETVKSMAVAIGILAASLWVIAQIPSEKLWDSVKAIVALAATIGLLALAVTKIGGASGKGSLSITAVMLGLSFAIKSFAAATKTLGDMGENDLALGLEGLLGICGILVSLMIAFRIIGGLGGAADIDAVSNSLLKIVGAMAIMAVVVKLVSGMGETEATKGIYALAIFMGAVLALALISRAAGPAFEGMGLTLLAMSASMLILVQVVKMVCDLNEEQIRRGAEALGVFLLVITSMVLISRLGGTATAGLALVLGSMAAAMVSLAFTVRLLGSMDATEMAKGLICIGIFSKIVIAMTLVAKIGGSATVKMAATIIAMAVAIGILAGVCILISLLDPKGIAKGLVAIGFLSVFMSMLIASTRLARNAKAEIIAMTAAIAILVGAVAVLSMMDPWGLARGVLAMSVLMGFFAAALAVSYFAKGSLGPIIAMTAAVAIIGGIVYLLAKMEIDNVLGAAASISLLLLAMSAALVLASAAGPLAVDGLLALGGMTLVVGALAGIIYSMQGIDAEQAIGIATSIGLFLLAMSAALVVLTLVGLGGPAALIGIGSLVVLIEALTGLMVGLGALMSYVPQAEEFLSKGIDVLNQIGKGVGEFVGNIVGGFLEAAVSTLPNVADSLSQFMVRLTPFLIGMKMVDTSTLEGVKNLAEAILLLTAGDLVSKLASFITGGNSIQDFADQLEPLGEAMKEYGDAVKGVDAEAILSSADAAKALTEVADSIPNEGGLLAKLVGDNDMKGFADKIVPFGEALKEYGDAVTDVNVEAIEASKTAADAVTSVADSIPNSGGLKAMIAGDNDMATFGTQMSSFGTALQQYSDAVTNVSVETIENSVSAAKAILEVADSIPNSGGLKALITGDNDVGSFALKMEQFGTAILNYSNSVKDVVLDSILSSTSGARSIISVIQSMAELDTSGVGRFITAVNQIATVDVNSFSSQMQALGTAGVNGFLNAFSSATTQVESSVSLMLTSALNLIQSRISLFESAGATLMTKFISGIRSRDSALTTAFTSGLGDAVRKINSYYSDFYRAGRYLVHGFAKGIDDYTYMAEAKSKAMAQESLDAAKHALDERSPSKKTYKIGAFFVQGFVNAITSMFGSVRETGAKMATNAKEGLESALSYISQVVDSDMDYSPTITPVVDLSEMKAGMRKMDASMSSIRASSISQRFNSDFARSGQNGVTSSETKNFNFTQNNYSPKALSRAEIYRQTRNQFSSFERSVPV